MVDKKVYQQAFEEALKDPDVKSNETDNADEQIRAAMIRYMGKQNEEVRLKEIGDYIRERTLAEDKLLPKSFKEAKADRAALEEAQERERVEREMRNYFEKKEEAIRLRRIQLYIKEQAAKEESGK
ncbi:MAG: hypothetical protein PUI34_07760 [Hornefia butyriciproducens]|nr:hypothetical protein [Hornefia butyriciproducens]